MRLKHQHASQPAHPVDIRESFRFCGVGHQWAAQESPSIPTIASFSRRRSSPVEFHRVNTTSNFWRMNLPTAACIWAMVVIFAAFYGMHLGLGGARFAVALGVGWIAWATSSRLAPILPPRPRSNGPPKATVPQLERYCAPRCCAPMSSTTRKRARPDSMRS